MNFHTLFRSSKKKHSPSPPSASPSSDGGGDSQRGPRLERCRPVRYADDSKGASPIARRARSLDAPPNPPGRGDERSFEKSFRVVVETQGDVDFMCRSVGVSCLEDFSISLDDWKEFKLGSLSTASHKSPVPLSKPAHPFCDGVVLRGDPAATAREGCSRDWWLGPGFRDTASTVIKDAPQELPDRSPHLYTDASAPLASARREGIKGVRPPALAPPPSIVNYFAPSSNYGGSSSMGRFGLSASESSAGKKSQLDVGLLDDRISAEERGFRFGMTAGAELTASCSFTTSNDDDSSSTTTDGISPGSNIRRLTGGWTKGEELGRGSYGTVYKVYCDDGGFCAVKEVSLLDPGNDAKQSIMQLEQEIVLLSRFEHENIVRYLGTEKFRVPDKENILRYKALQLVNDWWEPGRGIHLVESKLYIFLELVTQGSLVSLYYKYHLQDTQVSAYTRQILSGLKYLHAQNVVHRDIKCANILVDLNGSVKLADFGLAKEMKERDKLKSCKGSVYWMAPEVINPQMTYGPPADIWSLGCTVLEMLIRKPPYSNLEFAQALYKIGHGEKPDIPESLSKYAQDFINKCVQVDPSARPTASELLDHPFVKR